MSEFTECTRLVDAIASGSDDDTLDEHVRMCASCALVRKDLDRVEDALPDARQPVSPPLDWQAKVFERIDAMETQTAGVVSLDEERVKRAGRGAPRSGVTRWSLGDRFTATAVQIVEVVAPGSLVAGKYRLRMQIGGGQTGPVWAAVNEATSREVALKVLVRSECDSSGGARCDGRNIGSLKHRNIVDVFDIGQTQAGDPFLVMELLQGETLEELLMRKGRLDLREAVRMSCDVASALVAAHARSILHLDLTPRNIFIHRDPVDDSMPVVKVLGFGLKDAGVSSAVHAGSGGAVGSVPYMSPERLRVEADIDDRADIWSFGVVLFELLTGRRLYLGPPSRVIERILEGAAPPFDALGRAIPPGLASVVARCLRHDREDRYGSSAEMREELKRATAEIEPSPALSRTSGGHEEPCAGGSSSWMKDAPHADLEGLSTHEPVVAHHVVEAWPSRHDLAVAERVSVDGVPSTLVGRSRWVHHALASTVALTLTIGAGLPILYTVSRQAEPTPPARSVAEVLPIPPLYVPRETAAAAPSAAGSTAVVPAPTFPSETRQKATRPGAAAAFRPGGGGTQARPLPAGGAAMPKWAF